jgi:hypothetical protein
MAYRRPPAATSRSRQRAVGIEATGAQAFFCGLYASTEAEISSSTRPPAT